MKISRHAERRLAERGIDVEDVLKAVQRPMGPLMPGNGGNIVYHGRVARRDLMVVVSADGQTIVTAYWRD